VSAYTVCSVLQDLAGIAERTRAAIIVVHHTRKLQPGEEITANSCRGSNAILAMFRSMIGIDKPDPGSMRRRIRVLKENLGIAPPPVGFEITSSGLVFTAPPEKARKETNRHKAERWLRVKMKEPGAWYSAEAIEEEAEAAGFPKTGSLQRARESLGITLATGNVRKNGGSWEWRRMDDSGGKEASGDAGNSC
jgi:hypothetical protein